MFRLVSLGEPGSILTVPFIDKAEWFLRNRNTVVPLIEPTEQTTELFFVRLGQFII